MEYDYLGKYNLNQIHDGWKLIILKHLSEIDKNMWNPLIPKSLKKYINNKANEKAPNKFFVWLRNYLTDNQIILEIKTKFSDLRVYGYFNSKNQEIVKNMILECSDTCEKCGSKIDVKKLSIKGWLYNICKKCYNS